MRESIPMLKRIRLDDRVTVPMERELKSEIMRLKSDQGVDVLEWIRQLIRKELPTLKTKVS
jgi:hypothetical protein